MRIRLIILFLFVSLIASGTNYYVKTGGNDAASGLDDTNAWETLSKVNTVWVAGTFAPGDSILLNRGDSWYGQLVAAEAGTSGSPIVVGAYGTGDDPIVTGFQTIGSWTLYETGIYYNKIDVRGDELNMLTIDGVQYHMGIFPDLPTKYYIEKRLDNVNDQWIYDSDLPATPEWTYGSLVAIQNTGACTQCEITAHSGDTIWFNDDPSWSSYGEMNLNWRFFIQDNYETLTSFGEWFHDGDTLFMYFGAETPGDYTVQVAVHDTLMYNTGSTIDYIHVTDINFQGTNSFAIHSRYGDYWQIKDCEVEFAGEEAIYFYYADNCTVDNCIIHKCNDSGIYAARGCDYLTVSNNTIRDIGLFYGAGSSSHGLAISCIPGGGTAPIGTLVEYNTLRNIGRRGTWLDGSRDTIRYNYIDSIGVRYKDAGGIYTGTANDTLYAIYQNIILHTLGDPGMATATSTYGGADGIAIDYLTTGLNIYDNVIAYGEDYGINMNRAQYFTLTDNIFYDFASQGIALQEMSPVTGDPTGYPNAYLTVTGNIVVCADSTQDNLRARAYTARSDIADWGTINDNYYIYKNTDLNTNFVVYFSGLDYLTYAQWVSEFNYDTMSDTLQFANMDYVKLYYNNTKSDSIVILDYPSRDVYGTTYISSITLSPFTGTVLFPADLHILPSTGFAKSKTGTFMKDKTGTKFMKIE